MEKVSKKITHKPQHQQVIPKEKAPFYLNWCLMKRLNMIIITIQINSNNNTLKHSLGQISSLKTLKSGKDSFLQ